MPTSMQRRPIPPGAFLELCTTVGYKAVEIAVDTDSGEQLIEIRVRAADKTTILKREPLDHLGGSEIQRAARALLER